MIKTIDTNIIVSLIIIFISGVTLLSFAHLNKYKKVERYYYYHNKYLYILLELVYYLLFISLVFNARFLAYEAIKYFIYIRYKIKIKI